jgi:hypothetical protein
MLPVVMNFKNHINLAFYKVFGTDTIDALFHPCGRTAGEK